MNSSPTPGVDRVDKWVENIHEQNMQHGQESIVDSEPHLGMEFDSEAAAYEFYNEYSKRIGFGIRKEYGNKSKKDGVLTSRKFTCFKEGIRGNDKRREPTGERLRAETRTDCQARMIISLNRKIEKYKVVNFVAKHNHPLQPQEYVHMIRSHRHISEAQASQIILGDESGLRPKDLHEYISNQAGGSKTVGFTKQDLKNYLSTKRMQSLKFGEAGALIKEQRVSCDCRKFETHGILCSHALKVLDVMNIKLIPEHYILKRWTRDARSGSNKDWQGKHVELDVKADFMKRYNELCPRMIKLINKASGDHETYTFLSKVSEESNKIIDDILAKKHVGREASGVGHVSISIANDEIENNVDTVGGPTGIKKRNCSDKKKKRAKSWVERSSRKRKTCSNNKRQPSHQQAMLTQSSQVDTLGFQSMLTPSNQVGTLGLQHQATSQVDTLRLQAMLTQSSQVGTLGFQSMLTPSNQVDTLGLQHQATSQVSTFGLQGMSTQSSQVDTLGLRNFF